MNVRSIATTLIFAPLASGALAAGSLAAPQSSFANLDHVSMVNGKVNPNGISGNERLRVLLQSGQLSAGIALQPADAALFSRQIRRAAELEKQWAQDARKQLVALCGDASAQDAVSLAVALKGIDADLDRKRATEYATFRAKLSDEGRAALEEQLSITARAITKVDTDLIQFASARPSIFKDNVRLMCSVSEPTQLGPPIPSRDGSPQLSGQIR